MCLRPVICLRSTMHANTCGCTLLARLLLGVALAGRRMYRSSRLLPLFLLTASLLTLLLPCVQAADMVMHPSPGHYSGTLVNALLHHCQLPAMQLGKGAAAPLSLEGAAAVAAAAVDEGSSSDGANSSSRGGSGDDAQPPVAEEQQQQAMEQRQAAAASSLSSGSLGSEQSELDEEDEEEGGFQLLPAGTAGTADGTVRPGIVHRLDKGTTGLLVVAKTDAAHLSLAQQVRLGGRAGGRGRWGSRGCRSLGWAGWLSCVRACMHPSDRPPGCAAPGS